MDSFKEQIVKRIPSKSDKMSKIVWMVAGVALALGLVFFSIAFAPVYAVVSVVLGGFAIYGGYWMGCRTDVEYEYIFTNGELDIDKIIAQRTRKRLITMKFGSAEDFGMADDKYIVAENKTLVEASANNDEYQDYYVEFNHKQYGETAIIFSPDDDMLELIKTALPRTLRGKIK